MGYFNRGRNPGFSFIEVIMAMTILAMLVGISVVTYSEGIDQSKRDTALQQLHYVSNAIQRWEMVKNSRYSYSTLRPLEGEFLKNIEVDPWGNEYQINLKDGFVFSKGPFGTGTQDNPSISVSYDTDRDVPPAAPMDFVVVRNGTNVEFSWTEPVLNVDGSPIDGDLHHYNLYYRTSAQPTWNVTSPGGLILLAGDEGANVLWNLVVTSGDTVYFHLRAVDGDDTGNGQEGPPSQTGGIFVTQKTIPVINMFTASPPRCPLQTPFNVRIDVSDGDANLKKITLTGTGINEVWEKDGSGLENRFHPVISYTFTPDTTTTNFDLKVEAIDDENNMVDAIFATPIAFINNAPRINTLSPGSYNITVDPQAQSSQTSNYVEVTYLIEASDGESNLTQLTLAAEYDPDGQMGTPNYDLTTSWDYGPDGVSLAVESYMWKVLPRKDQIIDVTVTATDKVGAVSSTKRGTLRFSTDGTPPQHLTYWIDKSNPIMEKEEFLRWWIRDQTADGTGVLSPNYFEGDCWSWENESPPVTYYLAISTTSTADMIDFESQAITQSRTNAGSPWVEESSSGAAKFQLTPGDGLLGGFNFDPAEIYFTLLEARNSVGLKSETSATPLHHVSKISQDAFGYDATEPVISEISIDSLGPVAGTSDVWFDGVLNVSWSTEDYIISGDDSSGVGSGPELWEYYIIREQIPGGVQDLYNPTELDVYNTVRSPEFRSMQVDTASFPNARYLLNIRARDVAGNMSDFYSAGARLDMTQPTTGTSGTLPLITNQVGGFIYASNTILASWYDVFFDPESGIESYDWGVATTSVLDGAIPDIVPWQRVEGFLLNGTYVQNDPPLLTDGTDIYVCLRARNFAGRVSDVAYSLPAKVDVTMYTKLDATPRVGHESLSVQFSASVTGGLAPFEYNFLFDGTYGDSSRRCLISTTYTEVTTSFEYDITEFGAGRHSARVVIKDDGGAGTLSIQDIYFELYPSPYVLVVSDVSNPLPTRVRFYRSESLNAGFVWDWTGAAGASLQPIGLEMGPDDGFAVIPYDNLAAVDPGYARLSLVGDHGAESNYQALDFTPAFHADFFTPDRLSAFAVSPSGSYATFAGNGTAIGGYGQGWIVKILLNPLNGEIRGDPDTQWGAYASSTGKTVKMKALEIWDGGLSGAIGGQLTNLSPPNLYNGVAPLELGLTGQLYPYWNTYFGTQLVEDAFIGIGDISASPDNNWLVMTTINSLSDEIYVAQTKELAAGSGSRVTTSILGPNVYTNAVWMPDSSRFIVANRTTGAVYSCSIASYPAPLILQLVSPSFVGPVTGNPTAATHIDLSDDGKQLLLCGKSGVNNHVFRGIFTSSLAIKWEDWTLASGTSLVAARFIKPFDFGAPVIRTEADWTIYSSPTWYPEFFGANLWMDTDVKITYFLGSDILVEDWTPLSTLTSANGKYDFARFQFNVPAPALGGIIPFTFQFRNSVGASDVTTEFTINRP